MKIGLQIPDFTWPSGPALMGRDLAQIARAADDAGFDAVAVMDHLFQIGPVGPIENDMLEAYTTLGFLAAHTSRARLFTLVTGVTYRDPGMLAKIVTTLDVLSGGRAWLGVGAAWNDEESRGLGLLFPPTAERFERLEETLQICLQMWNGDDKVYDGTHYRLERTLNSPQSLTRPHPPIMIGAAGRRRRYAWWRNTPMRATSSAVPTCRASSMYSKSTASARAGTTPTSRRRRTTGSMSARTGSGPGRPSTSSGSSPNSGSRRPSAQWWTSGGSRRWRSSAGT
ncbi:MAG: TIGR03560 family F420-dependent LLM class oxidoreductase [Geodermatophilaceae bacterium]